MKLYEINEAIEACVDKETGEVIDEAALEELHIEKAEKIKNIALWIKNLKSDEASLKAERDAFDARMKAAKNRRESLMRYLEKCLDGESIKDTQFIVSWRKSQKTDVFDEDLIPVDYKIPQPYKLDVDGIKRTLKMGKTVPGARLIENNNMTVK